MITRTTVRILEPAETMVELRNALRLSKSEQEAFGAGWHRISLQERARREVLDAIAADHTPLPPELEKHLAAQQARNDYEWQQTHKDWPRGLTLGRVLREHWRPAVKFTVALVADATRTHWHKAFWFLAAVAGVVALVMWWGAL